MPRIRAEHQALADEIQIAGGSSAIIALEPATVARFRRSADTLAETLNDHARRRDGSRAVGSRAVEDLRTLMETATTHPDGLRAGFDIEVRGRVDELIQDLWAPNPVWSGGTW